MNKASTPDLESIESTWLKSRDQSAGEADATDFQSRGIELRSSDGGETGLIQTPVNHLHVRSANQNRKRTGAPQKNMGEPRGVVSKQERIFSRWTPSLIRGREAGAEPERIEADGALTGIEALIRLPTKALWFVDLSTVKQVSAAARQRGGRNPERGILRSKDRRQERDREGSQARVQSALRSEGQSTPGPDSAVVRAIWKCAVEPNARAG